MRMERLNNLPLNTVTPNFVAIFVFFGTASSFIEGISFSEIEAKREAILFLLGCSEVNSTWIITSGLANQRAPKALFTCVAYTKSLQRLMTTVPFTTSLLDYMGTRATKRETNTKTIAWLNYRIQGHF